MENSNELYGWHNCCHIVFVILLLVLCSPIFLLASVAIYAATTISSNVGAQPTGILYNPDNHLIYVANYASSTVSIINGSTEKVVATLLVGQGPSALTYDKEHHYIYVVCRVSNDVYIIDTTTNPNKVMSATINVGSQPISALYVPGSHHLYVSNTKSKTISVLDIGNIATSVKKISTKVSAAKNATKDNVTKGETITNAGRISIKNNSTITLTSVPYFFAYNRDVKGIYVTQIDNTTDIGTLSLINEASNKIALNIPTDGNHTLGISYDSANHLLYLLNQDSNTVSVLNGINSIFIKNIQLPLDVNPISAASSSLDNNLYVVGITSTSVYRIVQNTYDGHPLTGLGNSPFGIAYDRNDDKMFVTSIDNNTISVFSLNHSTNAP
jgi:YVTN family beta-propeller protein